MPKFWDAHVRPPRGGWHFIIAGTRLERHSEGDIIDEIRRWRKNNATYQSDAAIEAELWDYYCRQEPDRCGGQAVNPLMVPVPMEQRELNPRIYGPWVWQFLNFAAVSWTEGLRDWFLQTCDAIVTLLECPECREEWRSLLVNFPPSRITSRLEACQWVNHVHNQVNARKGKPIFPYSRMVTEYGAPIP